MGKLLTIEEFIEIAKEVHGNEYDYSLVEYKNCKEKIKIICPLHGIFSQNIYNHLNGKKCKLCSYNNSANKNRCTKEKFVEKAKEIHGNLYDYSLVDYKNNHIKIKIICKIHGEFEQKPNWHLNGNGCDKCGGTYKSTTKEFIEKASSIHKNLYDYSQAEYQGNKIKIKIICKKHGIFKQSPNSHLKGRGCPECGKILVSNKQKSTKEKFIEKAKKVHENQYDYSQIEYKTNHDKIIIYCNICEKFFNQIPNSHLNGHGCPLCSGGPISKKEIEFFDYMEIPQENRQKEIIINNKSHYVDGFIPETNTILEFLGNFWHGNPDIFDSNDINPKTKSTYGELYQKTIDRLKLFRENGYKVVYIWENEFKLFKTVLKAS